MSINRVCRLVVLLSLICLKVTAYAAADAVEVKKVLFIGDSMTGWLAERLNAYGRENGFVVAAEIWDGSTIRKWGATPRLAKLMKDHKPDVVFVSLGMNELYETNPSRRLQPSFNKMMKAIGKTPVVWIGPLSWPGKKFSGALDKWLAGQLGTGHYYNSGGLKVPRQSSTNPHPTRNGASQWMDAVVTWLRTGGAVALPGYKLPSKKKMIRPKFFNYRRMSAR